MTRGSLAALALALLVPRTSVAQELPQDRREHAMPCRPTIACTADIVPDGTLEIESGVIARRIGPASTQYSEPYLIKLSVAPWMQFQLSGNGWVSADRDIAASYFDNVTGGIKFHLWDQVGPRPSVSLSGALSIPTARVQPGYTPMYDAFVTAYVSKDFDWLHADLNLGVNVWRIDGTPGVQPWLSLALSRGLPHNFGVMLEAYYFGDVSALATHDGGVLSAISWSPRSWVTLDLGADIGWFPATRAFGVFCGATLIPVDFWNTRAELRRRAAVAGPSGLAAPTP